MATESPENRSIEDILTGPSEDKLENALMESLKEMLAIGKDTAHPVEHRITALNELQKTYLSIKGMEKAEKFTDKAIRTADRNAQIKKLRDEEE